MFGKKMVEGKATILAVEGYTGFKSTGPNYAWEHCKYIVEVRPETGDAFRAETVAKVAFLGGPSEGDVVNCKYDPNSHKVELLLDGDPRYDPRLQRAAEKAQHDAILHGTPGASPALSSSGYTPLDPELQALMDADEAERAGAASGPPSSPAPASQSSRLDQLQQLGELHKQGVLSDAEFEQEKARILGGN